MSGKKPFFINENLIPARAKLLYEIRLLKKAKKEFISHAFSKKGEIYYILHGTTETHKLTFDKLNSLKEVSLTFENN